jgi:hypothetical protein
LKTQERFFCNQITPIKNHLLFTKGGFYVQLVSLLRRLAPNYFFLGVAFLPAFTGAGFTAGFPVNFAYAISIEFKIILC